MKNTAGLACFRAGSIVLVVFGCVHLFAIFDMLFVEPTAPMERQFKEIARSISGDFGPFHFTTWGGIVILNSSYSVLLVFAGVLNLIVAQAVSAAGLLRRVALVNGVFAAVLLAICLACQFPPPALFAAVALILFIISTVRATPRAADAAHLQKDGS